MGESSNHQHQKDKNDHNQQSQGNKTKDYQVINELGRGSYGTVFRVVSLVDNLEYVMKKINIKHMKPKHQREALKEAQILRKISHQNIIKYHTSFMEKECLYIIMEYAENGDLQQLIKEKKKLKQHFSEQEIWDIAWNLVMAVDYLHKNNIIHRDIKTLNIFLTKAGKIKLGDLGVSKIVSSQMAQQATVVGTPLYLAPELVKQKPYDFKVDLWAIGCVLYHISALEPPFQGDNLITLGFNIVHKNPKPLPGLYSGKLSSLVNKFLEKNPQMRPSSQDILDKFPNKQAFLNQDKYEYQNNEKNNIISKATNNNKSSQKQLKKQPSGRSVAQQQQGRIDVIDSHNYKVLTTEDNNNIIKSPSEKRQQLLQQQQQKKVKNDYNNINLKMKDNLVYDIISKQDSKSPRQNIEEINLQKNKSNNINNKVNTQQSEKQGNTKNIIQTSQDNNNNNSKDKDKDPMTLSKELEKEYKQTKQQLDNMHKQKMKELEEEQDKLKKKREKNLLYQKQQQQQEKINSSKHYINSYCESKEEEKINQSKIDTKIHNVNSSISPKNKSKQLDISSEQNGSTIQNNILSNNNNSTKQQSIHIQNQQYQQINNFMQISNSKIREKNGSSNKIEPYYKNFKDSQQNIPSNSNITQQQQDNNQFKIRPYSAQIKSGGGYKSTQQKDQQKERESELQKIDNLVQNFKKANEEYLSSPKSNNFFQKNNLSEEKRFKQKQQKSDKIQESKQKKAVQEKQEKQNIVDNFEQKFQLQKQQKKIKILQQQQQQQQQQSGFQQQQQEEYFNTNINKIQQQQQQTIQVQVKNKNLYNQRIINRPKSANIGGYGSAAFNRKNPNSHNGRAGATGFNFFMSPFSESENSHKKIVTNYLKNTIGKMTCHKEQGKGDSNIKQGSIEPIKEVEEYQQYKNYIRPQTSKAGSEVPAHSSNINHHHGRFNNINAHINFTKQGFISGKKNSFSRPQTAQIMGHNSRNSMQSNNNSNRKKITLNDLVNN